MASQVAVSLALVAMLLVSSAQALKCYQCADAEALSGITGGAGAGLLDNPLLKAAMPPCKEFDPSNPESRFEFDCQEVGAKAGCAKTKMGEVTMRTCQAAIPQTGCQSQGEVSMCYCEGDLCNGAGLATPGLLLLAPAALLAMLRA